MRILVLNAGSSTIKYDLFDAAGWTVLASGETADHGEGLQRVVSALAASGAMRPPHALRGIGHRVVHGGEHFREAAIIDAAVLETIRATVHLAPLHNPASLAGIEMAMALYPEVPQVAVFDTAFHQTIPPRAFRYAIPRELYVRRGVRRYGFHGTSHAFVARRAAELLGRPLETLRLVTLHLGNGASAAAIQGGRSVETSMGMTPLEGLVMGTRSGDLDPAVPVQLARDPEMTPDALEHLLNGESGMLGLCGASDMREVLRRAAAGDPDARLAIEVYCHRVKKYVGAYHAVLGGLDALVFTAGVGENSPEIRAGCCEGLEHLGIEVDPGRNQAPSREARAIHAEGTRVAVLVVPTHEELEIARQTLACIERAEAAGRGSR